MNKVNASLAKKAFFQTAQKGDKKTQFKMKLESDKKAFCGKLCLHTPK
ncbi:hypothetical protein MED121_16974 [Marinomonas sp. MED121]|nr:MULTISPECIES: hypothetical protein [unclassified Marinomonas]EAQ67640.1 hypothetical protein MED121_16974 [Marinomonas sp. MED121]